MRLIYFSIFMIFLISFSAATPTITFQNEEIRAGETAIAKISVEGEFTREIDSSQIKIFEGRKEIFIENEIFYYNETHYLILYTTRPGEFNLQISEVLYKSNDTLASKDFNILLNISLAKVVGENESYLEVLSIRPGAYKGITKPEIKLINKGEKDLEISYLDQETSLSPMKTKEITFIPESELTHLEISSYKNFLIPIIYLSSNNENFTAPKGTKLKSDPEFLFENLISDEESKASIQLFNFGDYNLTINSVQSLEFLEFENPLILSPREVVNMTVSFDPKIQGFFEGSINISYTQNGSVDLLKIPFNFYVLPKGNNQSSFEAIENKSCEEEGGRLCGERDCLGKAFFTKEKDLCCLDECGDIKYDPGKESELSWIWGVLILIILVAAGYYFYKKSKKVGPKKPSDALKKTTDKIESRNPKPEGRNPKPENRINPETAKNIKGSLKRN